GRAGGMCEMRAARGRLTMAGIAGRGTILMATETACLGEAARKILPVAAGTLAERITAAARQGAVKFGIAWIHDPARVNVGSFVRETAVDDPFAQRGCDIAKTRVHRVGLGGIDRLEERGICRAGAGVLDGIEIRSKVRVAPPTS